jgi:hypothetical protein
MNIGSIATCKAPVQTNMEPAAKCKVAVLSSLLTALRSVVPVQTNMEPAVTEGLKDFM